MSQECSRCYAETLSHRNPGTLGVWGPNGTRVVAAEATWREPLKWDRKAKEAGERHRVFCASLADVFEDWQGRITNTQGFPLVKHFSLGWTSFHGTKEHADETDSWVTLAEVRSRLFDLIDETPNLDWLLLTKRPENIARMIIEVRDKIYLANLPRNIWIGTSVGVRDTLPRIDHLRTVHAAVRFLSVEPLLEDLGTIDLTGIHLVIVGGESGHGARPMHPDWARSIRDQCQAAGVAFFFKQWGEWLPQCNTPFQPRAYAFLNSDGRFQRDATGILTNSGWTGIGLVGKKAAGRVLDGRTWDEMPKPSTKGST